MNLRYSPNDFVVKANGTKKIRVIEIVPNQIVTKEIILAPKIENGQVVADTVARHFETRRRRASSRDRQCRRRFRARIEIEKRRDRLDRRARRAHLCVISAMICYGDINMLHFSIFLSFII